MSEITTIKLKNIVPDENQPRKDFDAARLGQLARSIEQQGILNPLVVEPIGDGNYLLVDGERRYRAALSIELKEVPAIIQDATDESSRIIRQFHLQEQHLGWTAVEKANAVARLSEQMDLPITEIARLLSLPKATISEYKSFFELIDRKLFERSELNIHWAVAIKVVTRRAKKVYETHTGEYFDEAKEKKLEKKLIQAIKNGEVQKRRDFVKLTDAFTHQPEAIEKYIESSDSIERVYFEHNGEAQAAARLIRTYAGNVPSHVKTLAEKGGVPEIQNQRDQRLIRRAIQSLEGLLSDVE